MTRISKGSLYLTLHHYAKNYVDYDILVKAMDNGNYEKALTKMAIKIGKSFPYKDIYGVSRAEVIDILDESIREVATSNCLDLTGKAFVYKGGFGKLRVMFADSKVEVQRQLSDVPHLMYGDMPPKNSKWIYKVEEFTNEGVRANGELFPYDDSFINLVVNSSGRLFCKEKNSEDIDNE